MARTLAAANEIKKLTNDRSRVLKRARKKLSFCISSRIIRRVPAGEGIIPVCLNLVSASIHQAATIIKNANKENTIPGFLRRCIKETVRGQSSAN
jgi:hypothetical protein